MDHVITLSDKRFTGGDLEMFMQDTRVYSGEWKGLS
jgi:hypothetical protein